MKTLWICGRRIEIEGEKEGPELIVMALGSDQDLTRHDPRQFAQDLSGRDLEQSGALQAMLE